MARMIDLLLSDQWEPPVYCRPQTPGFWDKMLDAVLSAECVVVDNVADFFFEADPREEWSTYEDFPNIAPPFPCMWIEFRGRGRVNRGGSVTLEPPMNSGCLLRSVVCDRGWQMEAAIFLQGPHEKLVNGPIGLVKLAVLKDGSIDRQQMHVWAQKGKDYDDKKGLPIEIPALGESGRQAVSAYSHAICQACIIVAQVSMLALSFIHCKNVEMRRPEPPGPLSKKWLKKHGRPLVRYHVLDIESMRAVMKTEGRSGEVGIRRALHICRGHFATYTEEAPLFGRVTGTFWKSQHIRGSVESGVVVKDYNVKANLK